MTGCKVIKPRYNKQVCIILACMHGAACLELPKLPDEVDE